MFDLEKAIQEWRRELAKSQSMEDGYLAELEGHLRDGIEELSEQGVSEREAFEKMVAKLGGTDEIDTELYRAHAARRSGRPPWKPPR